MKTAEASTVWSPTWRRLLLVAAVADLAVMLIVSVGLRDAEAFAIAAIFLLGLALLRLRRGMAGVVMLGLVSLDVVVFMLPAAASNFVNREDLLDVLVPATLTAISLTAAVAAAASVARRRDLHAGGRPARIVAQHAVAVLTVALAAGVLGHLRADDVVAAPGDLTVDMRNVKFIPDVLAASPGEIGLFVTNTDLFWHTFTIDELGIDVGLPTGGERRTTVTARAGRYRIICRVLGHESAGMVGELIVR